MKSEIIILRVYLSLLGLLSCFVGEAQNKCFSLSAPSAIYKNYFADDRKEEFAPWAIYNIDFNYTSNGLTISSPEIGTLKMSNDIIYKELDNGGLITYIIQDAKNAKYSLIYFKSKECSSDYPVKSIFSLTTNNDYRFLWDHGVMLYNDCNNKSDYADQNLCSATPEEDLLIKFLKSIATQKINRSNSKLSTQSAESSATQLGYGEFKLTGYLYDWNSASGKSREIENGTLTLEFGRNHYIGLEHGNQVTNLSPNRKSISNWSTRKGAIPISLPKGVTISNSDEIICWENFYDNYRNVVIFIYSLSSNRLQCFRTSREQYANSSNENINVYYFSTMNASAWPKLKRTLLHELPYCSTRIY